MCIIYLWVLCYDNDVFLFEVLWKSNREFLIVFVALYHIVFLDLSSILDIYCWTNKESFWLQQRLGQLDWITWPYAFFNSSVDIECAIMIRECCILWYVCMYVYIHTHLPLLVGWGIANVHCILKHKDLLLIETTWYISSPMQARMYPCLKSTVSL